MSSSIINDKTPSGQGCSGGSGFIFLFLSINQQKMLHILHFGKYLYLCNTKHIQHKMDASKLIGSNIKKYRESFGLKQEDLASCLNVSREQISNYERGEREIPLFSLEKLSILFDVDIDALLEENIAIQDANISFAFRSDNSPEDIKEILFFKKIVFNYLKIEKLLNEI
jgi:transcriptional regulator with XRE-family HTH domain